MASYLGIAAIAVVIIASTAMAPHPFYAQPSIQGEIVYNVLAIVEPMESYHGITYISLEMRLPTTYIDGRYIISRARLRVVVHEAYGVASRKTIEELAYHIVDMVESMLDKWGRAVRAGPSPLGYRYFLVSNKIIRAAYAAIDDARVFYDEKTGIVLGGKAVVSDKNTVYTISVTPASASPSIAEKLSSVSPPSSRTILTVSSIMVLILVAMIANNIANWKYYAVS